MKRLIVNADDFGIHPSVNAGIMSGHKDGIITSASLMAGGAAFDEAVQIARECPALGVGVHLTLVGGGRPVLPAWRIPSLVDEQGRFFFGHQAFILRYLSGKIKLAEAEAEMKAQVERICAADITPSHLDSHQHLHALPGIFTIVGKLAKRFSIKAVRKPAESLAFFGGAKFSVGRVIGRTALSLLAAWSMRNMKKMEIAAPQHFFGMLAGGQMEFILLQNIIEGLPAGASEIMVHPGVGNGMLAVAFPWKYHWEEERIALTSPQLREILERRSIRLISFREL